MPRSHAQNEQLRTATRERLLDAALTLFARDGFQQTSVKTIAQRAGLAAGLLYSHFDSKESLLRAIFERSMDDVRESFRGADHVAPPYRITALVLGAVEIVRERLDFWQLVYHARTQPAVVAALGSALDAWSKSIVATLERFLAEGDAPDAALDARALFATIDGMCQHYALDPRHYPIDGVARRVIARWTPSAATRALERA
ncbi:MAG: TetR/AcrR family transcriptional regulator [Gemmatimonadaceae bacterium]